VKKSIIFWDVARYILKDVHRRSFKASADVYRNAQLPGDSSLEVRNCTRSEKTATLGKAIGCEKLVYFLYNDYKKKKVSPINT
jgi:hypothetical protein